MKDFFPQFFSSYICWLSPFLLYNAVLTFLPLTESHLLTLKRKLTIITTFNTKDLLETANMVEMSKKDVIRIIRGNKC